MDHGGAIGRGRAIGRALTLHAPLAATLLVAACSPGAPTPGPGPSASGGPAGNPFATVPGQTETAWGRIWDGLPAWFPLIPGAVPATDAGDGAASALLAVDAPEVAEVATFYRGGLEALGMTVSQDGPLEDGSVTVSGSNGYGCEARVSVKPAGSTNLITVLYGTGCPFETGS